MQTVPTVPLFCQMSDTCREINLPLPSVLAEDPESSGDLRRTGPGLHWTSVHVAVLLCWIGVGQGTDMAA